MRRALLVLLLAAGAVAACGKSTANKAADAVRLTPAQVETRLAAADAADGHVDRVVAKCASCNLGMEGDPKYTSVHAGYEMHFCSEECKKRFDADPDKIIAKLPDTPQV